MDLIFPRSEVLVLAVGLTSARWMRKQRSDQPKDTSFIGEATNELSTTILQGYIDDDKDIAFSPLGYSTILAILAEGAKGETRSQLVSALHLPEDQNLIRKTYRYIMERLKFRNQYKYNQPELKNFFYIYKNYTINEDYKKILEDFYLTDVRSVERYHMLEDSEDHEDEKVKKDEPKKEVVEDLMPPKESNEKLISYAVEDIPTKVDITHINYKPAKNIKEKIKYVKNSQDTKKYETDDEEETMVAVEARTHAKSFEYRVLNEKNDIASSISVNSVGEKASKSTNSLMLIFNGMYFRGSWKKPFDKVESGVFYKSNTEKKQVQMMKTLGSYKTNSFPELDSEAILLPYDGDRYALLLLVPRSRDGLIRLVADLPAVSLTEIQERLREEELQVSLPTFFVETTTKPVAALAKFGVSSIFGRDAELTGISEKQGLFVQELVQNVAVRVDNTDASASAIGASNAAESLEYLESLKNLPLHETKEPRRFCVEHPFVFYIVDRLDNLVIVAGKVTDPQSPSEKNFNY
ncbi:jg25451 [Pararge aegeria aegeria]|uniref:Jg25451 protein n=1 Tax=Pararge aegeria aegeria TaxID=348720 RepID=A0A8S4SA35_9NEOP|nr:jg25451 [Pararge aegeria aegeria]